MSLQFLQMALESDNVKAFLQTIRHSEGTAANDGYNYIFGSSPANNKRFTDFSEHPNIHVPFGKTTSSAAGAYQILFGTWEQIRDKYKLSDFSPEIQDIAAVEILSQRNCLQAIIDGKFEHVLRQCGPIWASFPDNNYNQHPHSREQEREWYIAAGGKIND